MIAVRARSCGRAVLWSLLPLFAAGCASGGSRLVSVGRVPSLTSEIIAVGDAGPQAFPQDKGQKPPKGPQEAPGLIGAENSLNLIRYIGADRSRWPDSGKPTNLAGLYTRIEILTDATTAGDLGSGQTRGYEIERRGWLARLISNRTIAVTTVARAEIRDPDISTAVPLFSLTHDSVRGSGEVFVTNYTSSDVQSPLFRIGPNTTLTIQLNTKHSDQQKTDITTVLIQSVQKAITIAAPTSSVLTTLSKPDVDKSAKAFDSVIGGLFSQDTTENIAIGRLIDSWVPGAQLTVTGAIPRGLVYAATDDKWEGNPKPHPDFGVGLWHVRLTCPRPSIFDVENLCSADQRTFNGSVAAINSIKTNIVARLTASQILQTKLSSQVTVRDFILTQEFYTKFLAKEQKAPKDTEAFCLDTIGALYEVGLNDFDAALVLRAISLKLSGIASLDTQNSIKTNCAATVADQVTL
jgi:hypothetical protein